MMICNYFLCRDCGGMEIYSGKLPEVLLCQKCLDELEVPDGYDENQPVYEGEKIC